MLLGKILDYMFNIILKSSLLVLIKIKLKFLGLSVPLLYFFPEQYHPVHLTDSHITPSSSVHRPPGKTAPV